MKLTVAIAASAMKVMYVTTTLAVPTVHAAICQWPAAAAIIIATAAIWANPYSPIADQTAVAGKTSRVMCAAVRQPVLTHIQSSVLQRTVMLIAQLKNAVRSLVAIVEAAARANNAPAINARLAAPTAKQPAAAKSAAWQMAVTAETAALHCPAKQTSALKPTPARHYVPARAAVLLATANAEKVVNRVLIAQTVPAYRVHALLIALPKSAATTDAEKHVAGVRMV